MRKYIRFTSAFLISLVVAVSPGRLTSVASASTISALPGINSGSTIVGSHLYTIHLDEAVAAGFYVHIQFDKTTAPFNGYAFGVRFTTVGDHTFTYNPSLTGTENVANDSNINFQGSSQISSSLPPGTYNITIDYDYDDPFNPFNTLSYIETLPSITLLEPCAPGTYSGNGGVPLGGSCTLAPLGRFVAQPGSTSSTICPAGHFAISEGSASCEPAEPGKFSAAGTGNVLPSDCPAGSYQPLSGQSECLPARVGHFVSSTGQWRDTECEPGTYRLETGETFCLDAPAGTYVALPAQHATFDCLAGTYSANARSTACTQAPANFYVATNGAISATACPAGQVSDAGSNEASDCHVPVVAPATVAPVTKAQPAMTKWQKRSLKSIAIEIGMNVPAKAKVTGTLDKASKKLCKVSGSNLKASKAGNCNLKLKVKPKKGAATSQSTTITVS